MNLDEENKLDLLLAYYRKMLSDHDDERLTQLNEVSQKIIGANHNHSAFRRYQNRLIADNLIERDHRHEGGDDRLMASQKGLTYSYAEDVSEKMQLKSASSNIVNKFLNKKITLNPLIKKTSPIY